MYVYNVLLFDSTLWEDDILAGWLLATRLAFSGSKMAAMMAVTQNQECRFRPNFRSKYNKLMMLASCGRHLEL